jgi:hypothetical protein
MVTEQGAPMRGAIPQRPPVNVMRSSKEEEGPVKGEIWAVLRALAFLVGFIILVGYVIA